MNICFIVTLLLVTAAVLYFKPKAILWTLAIVATFAAFYRFVGVEINLFVYTILALITVAIALVGNLKFIRAFVFKPLYSGAKKVLPAISETEALALNAGDSWWERDVFQGNPDYNKLHDLNVFKLTDEEQSFVDNEVTTLCKMIDDWKVTHEDMDLPVDVWNYIRDNGFFGLVIKKEYGGKGFSAAAHSEVVLRLATRSTTVGVTVMVPNSLGPGELLYHYGTKEQKDYYLPRLAKGQEIPCFALTGPTAGSDATSIPDKGIVCMGEYNGKPCLGIKLSEVNKRYITLAPVSTLVGLAFVLKDPDGLLKGLGREGITCALLPHDHEGLEIGNRLFPLNQAFMNGTVRIKESFIPIDWVIGGQSMCGEGWRMLVECLSIGRAISLPTCGTANSLMATVMTSAYALVREQFKVPVASFEGVEEGLAKMAGLTYMMNAARRLTVAAVDAGISPSVASAIVKCHLTDSGRTVMNWAMDIHAGRGVIMGPNNYLARAYEGIPVGITVEGANIMTRNLLIFGQGMMRCHPYIRTIYESLTTDDGYDRFDAAVTGHIGYFSQNIVRALVNGLSGGLTAKGYSSKYNQYYKQLSRLSSAYALVSDGALIILNGSLKFRERLSARLGDVMSYLYMASAVLKYCKLDGENKADELYVKWALEHSLYQAQQALIDTLDNFPSRAFACAAKFMIFPYGKPLSAPSDKLEHALVKELMRDGDTRKAFKKYVPMDLNMQDPLGRMELAYQTVLSASEIKAKIIKAVKAKQLPKANVSRNKAKALELGIISEAEFEQLNKADEYTSQVIQVDEFGPYELGPKNAHPNWSK